MIFQPSDLAVVVFVLLVAVALATILEACWTYWHWWRRWRTPVRPRPGPVVVRGPFRDAEDQSPYGTGTSLVG
jgi:hypothetical protein